MDRAQNIIRNESRGRDYNFLSNTTYNIKLKVDLGN